MRIHHYDIQELFYFHNIAIIISMRSRQSPCFQGESFREASPEIKLESSLSVINDRIFEQAEQVKYHLRNKSSTRANSRYRNERFNDFVSLSYEERGRKRERKQQNSNILGEHKLFKSNNMKAKNIRTLENLISNSLEEEKLSLDKKKGLFQKITLHSLHQKRQQIEEQLNKIDTFYSYALNKIDKIKRLEQKKARQAQKFQKLSRQKLKSQKAIIETKHYYQEANRRRNQTLRSQVLNHRLHKEQTIQKSRRQKYCQGNSCRLHSQQLRQLFQEQCEIRKQEKQLLFMNQKINELNHKRQVAKMNEQRKKQASFRFKQRWIQEFHSIQKSKNQVRNKKKRLSYKIRQALSKHPKVITYQ